MPLVLNTDPDKDLTFVRHYIKTKDMVAACSQARIHCFGYDQRDVAYHQLARPEIKALIAAEETRVANTPPAELTQQSLISDHQRIFEEAMQEKEFQAAIAAKKEQAQLMGLHQENININVTNDVSAMSDTQIVAMLKQRALSRGVKVIDGQFRETQKAGIGQIGKE